MATGYRSKTPKERELELQEWRPWTFDETTTPEELRLRKIISGAFLRLSRLDDSNPEVNHARSILLQAKNGGSGSWP